MPLITIPRNTYQLKPTGYAPYWQAGNSEPTTVRMTGRVPLWVTFHDGGPQTRILHVMVVRVCPDLEVVLVGTFRSEIVIDEIEAAIQNRLSKPRWPERKWWVSHVVYLAQRPKRRAKKKKRQFNHRRFCLGSLLCSDKRSRLLAFIPLARLKLKIQPEKPTVDADKDDSPDLRFEVDTSNRQQRNIRNYVTRLADLERWEQKLVSRALCHLLGESYIEAVIQASEQIVGGDFTNSQRTMINAMHSTMKSKPEGFRPVRWLDPPECDDQKLCYRMNLTATRFPMGNGPDPEMSVRPWVPDSLLGVVTTETPLQPYCNMCLQLEADPQDRGVSGRWVINPLLPYGILDD